MSRLENWAIVIAGDPLYTAPEAMVATLSGYIYDDKRFCDGTLVRTSRLAGLTLNDEGKATSARTANTTYALGAMHGDFARFMAQNNVSIGDYAKRLEAKYS